MRSFRIAKYPERKWHHGHEMLLIPGAHDCDKKLTELILACLKKDFSFDGVNIVETHFESTHEDQYRERDKKSFM